MSERIPSTDEVIAPVDVEFGKRLLQAHVGGRVGEVDRGRRADRAMRRDADVLDRRESSDLNRLRTRDA